jgi:deoxyadenosine/deoxycytidine kinase
LSPIARLERTSYLRDFFSRIVKLRLFQRVVATAASDVGQPDLIVYLDASTDVLLERIRQRARIYEETIDGAHLDELKDAYDQDLTSAEG